MEPPATELAREHGVSPLTMRNILQTLGIDYKHRKVKPEQNQDLAISALILVVSRIARELNISATEIEPFTK